MLIRSLKLILGALVLLLLVACPPPPGPGQVNITITPTSADLFTGQSQQFTATVTGAANTAVTWTATDGTITGTGNTVTYTAPDTVGSFDVTATSVADPSRSASATVAVAAQARIEITSDTSFLLTAIGETARVTAVVYDDAGRIDPDAVITWTSSDPTAVSVAADGLITALAMPGYASVRASYGTLTPQRADVAIAQPASNTALIDEVLVTNIAPDLSAASLQQTDATLALQVGDIIVSNAGILSRITGVTPTADSVEVTLEDATLAEAFDELIIEGLSEPISYDVTITDDLVTVSSADPRIGMQLFGLRDLKCETEAGVGVDVTLDAAEINITHALSAGFEHDTETGITEFFLSDAPTFEATLGVIELSVGGNINFTCSRKLLPLSVPVASFWGLVSIVGDITPSIGFEINAAYNGATLRLAGPSVRATVEYTVGLRYGEPGWVGNWAPFSRFDRDFEASWGRLETELSHGLEFYAGPFLAADLGLSLRMLTFNAVGADMIKPKLSGGANLTLPLGDRYASTYRGPEMALQARLAADLKVELTGLLARALGYFNIKAGLPSINHELFNLEHDISPRPAIASSTSTVSDSVVLTATVPDWLLGLSVGRPVEFVVFRPGQTTGTVVGQGTVNSNRVAQFTWRPSSSDNGTVIVAALLYDLAFGTVNRPYRSSNTLTLTVNVPASAISVAVSPTSATLAPNATQQFTATVTGTTNTAVTWTTTCGTITGTGNTVSYRAPSSPGSCTVTATSVADPSQSASASVTVTATTPPPGADFTTVSAGSMHSLALDSQGDAWAWGYGWNGQLGNGGTSDSWMPVAVSMPTGVSFTAVSTVGGHSLALATTGNAWAWGPGENGQLGNDSTSNQTTPVPVSMPTGVSFTAVSAGGRHSLALDNQGNAWAWGHGQFGNLGNGDTLDRWTPVAVSMPTGVSFSAVSAGDSHSLALDSQGTAWAWGWGTSGQLGSGGSVVGHLTPARVTMPTGVSFSAVSAGVIHSLALDSDGNAWAWGDGRWGQLGNGSTSNQTTPVPVTMP